MSTNTAQNTVVDIIRDVEMPVTPATLKWVEAIYAAGAVSYNPDGTMKLHPAVRKATEAIHHILAGGEVEFVVRREGDETFAELEKQFEEAIVETNKANELRDPERAITPYMP